MIGYDVEWYRERRDITLGDERTMGWGNNSIALPFIPVIRLRRVCSGASLGTHFIIMKQTKS